MYYKSPLAGFVIVAFLEKKSKDSCKKDTCNLNNECFLIVSVWLQWQSKSCLSGFVMSFCCFDNLPLKIVRIILRIMF